MLNLKRTLGILILLAATPAQANRLTGERSLNNTSYGYAVVDNPVRQGQESQRFEVRPGDCAANGGWSDCANDRERSEFRLDKTWSYGTNIWIAYSVFLPVEFPTSNRVRTTIGQIHQRGGPSGTAGGLPSLPPLLQLGMIRNEFLLGVHFLTGDATNIQDRVHKFALARVSDMRGRWTDLMIHFDTNGDKQVLEIFVDGSLRATVSDWIKFKPQEYYFRYGIYRSFVSRHAGRMPTQILFVDEVRVGDEFANVAVTQNRPVD